MLHRVIAAFLVVVVVAAGCGRKAAPAPLPPDAVAGPTAATQLPPHAAPVQADVAAAPAPVDPPDAAPPAADPSGFLPCNPLWVLPADPEVRLLGAALAGGIAAILVEHAGSPILLLLGGDPVQATSVAPSDAPPAEADAEACGPLHGHVASYGDRYLVAWGRVRDGRLAVRVRAVLPTARLLPVDLPGRPGTTGEPTLEVPASGEEVRIRIDPYPAAVLVTAWGPGGSGNATVSPTGAPLDADKLGWSLVPSPPGSPAPWLLPPPLADSMAVRYVGPLQHAALAVEDGDGTVVLVRAGSAAEPFRFLDGWVPGPAEPVWFAPGRVLRLLPGDGPARVAAYDSRGGIAVRLELSAGATPLAVSRDGRTVLFLADTGALGACSADSTLRLPQAADVRGALAAPGSGAAACGRGR